MKLATARTAGADGRLLIVDDSGKFARPAEAASTLLEALERWDNIDPLLREEAQQGLGNPLADFELAAVLPRSFQFLDASAFLAHNHILAEAWGFERRTQADSPLMYQGLSDRFFGPGDTPTFPRVSDQVDFEAEIGIIVDAVPMGTLRQDALKHVRLIVLINDWSLRAFGPAEMKGGFGFIQAKPPTSVSAFAVTPDELGPCWRDGKVDAHVLIERNGTPLGRPSANAMSYDFGELIAHACHTRDLAPGTIIGSGTISQMGADAGAGCIAERRALDHIAGRPLTDFLRDGERVTLTLQCKTVELQIDQTICIRS